MFVCIEKSNLTFKIIATLLVIALISSFATNLMMKVNAGALGRKEVAIFLAGSIIGGMFYDGVKWVVSWGLAALTPTGIGAAAAILAIAGVAAVSLYMLTTSTVNYVTNSAGCVMRPGSNRWDCPYFA